MIYFRATFIFFLSLGLAEVCFGQADKSAGTIDAKVRDEIIAAVKAQLSEVSSVPQAAIDKLRAGRSAPDIKDFPNEPLSAVFLQLWPHRAEAGTKEELTEYCKFGDEVFAPGPQLLELFRRGPQSGQCSLVQSQDIRSIECKGISADRAHGVIRLNIEGEVEAQVLFLALREMGKWRLNAFRIPAWEVETTRGADGDWKATGECVHPAFDVRLPKIDADLENEVSAPRVVVTLAAGLPGKKAAAEAGPILSWRGRQYDFAPTGETSFPIAIAAHLKQKKWEPKTTTAVIRASATANLQDVFAAVKELAKLGFGQVGFDGATSGRLNYTVIADLSVPAIAAKPVEMNLKAAGRALDLELAGEPVSPRDLRFAMLKQVQDTKELRVVKITADNALRYDSFLQTLGSASGYMDPDDTWQVLPIRFNLADRLKQE